MHLHGHFFRLVNARGLSSFKDTVLVEPMGRREVVFQADHRAGGCSTAITRITWKPGWPASSSMSKPPTRGYRAGSGWSRSAQEKEPL